MVGNKRRIIILKSIALSIFLLSSPTMYFNNSIIEKIKEGSYVEDESLTHDYPPYIDEEEGRNAYIKSLEIRLEDVKKELSEKEKELSEKDAFIKEYESKIKSLENSPISKTSSKEVSSTTQTFEATYYGMDCNGCSGITASGLNTNGSITYKGMRIIAVDKNVIPLHSIVEITHNGNSYKAIAKDTGGAIKGNRIDILVGSEAESSKYGRHDVSIKVLEYGDNKYKKE